MRSMCVSCFFLCSLSCVLPFVCVAVREEGEEKDRESNEKGQKQEEKGKGETERECNWG